MWYRRRERERESEEVPCWCEENALRVFCHVCESLVLWCAVFFFVIGCGGRRWEEGGRSRMTFAKKSENGHGHFWRISRLTSSTYGSQSAHTNSSPPSIKHA